MRPFTYRTVLVRAAAAFAVLAAVAACSDSLSSRAPAPGLIPAAAPRATPTPLSYVYVVNYNGNDIAQYEIDAQARPPLKPIAPNFSLPSTCTNPDSFVTAPHMGLAFVSCFSGEVVALQIKADHTLATTKIAPVPVPSPLSLLAPRAGARDVLYATEYPGAVAELKYAKASLKLEHTYPTNSQYPDEMAFYSSGGKSTLFVAAPFASAACGSSSASGAVLPYAQTKRGGLTAEAPLPTCGSAYDVVVSGDYLYWAGPNVFGGYDVTRNAPLPSPSPPWPANDGPSYYPNAVTNVHAPSKPKGATQSGGGMGYSGIFVGSNNGNGYVIDGRTGKSIDAFSLGTHFAIQAAQCQFYANAVTVLGSRYQALCFTAEKDDVEFGGLPELKPSINLRKLFKLKGDFPIDVHISDPCDDYEYYYYYC
ncbi:MAG: hypothetical protein JO029_09760 [Candidatus Eremiobacteraeota bacterium]|nr:hypothetical protein [Candidatus Eremiobacteraeota bacterium]